MKYITSAVAVAALARFAYGQVSTIHVNTVTLTECQPALISWTGGVPPYYLSFIPAGQTDAPATKIFPETSDTGYTWTVDLESGTSLNTKVTDSQGNIGYSAIETIVAGSSSSCLNSSVSDIGTPVGSTSAASSTSNGASASTTPSGSSSSSGAAASSNAGSRSSVGAYSVAAAMGLIGAALF